MSSFVRPFNPASVTRQVEDITISLPDHVPTDPLISWPYRVPTDPLVRPGVARYAGATLVLMHIHSEAPFDFSSPVIGTVRNVNLDVTLSGGIDQLLEISPLPFGIMRTLRTLKQGLPTFYFGYSRTANIPPDDELVNPGMPPVSVMGDAYMGVLFQDRVALAPWSWIELLGSAMQESGDTSGASDWNSLTSLYTGIRSLRVLDHVGRPAKEGQSFQIKILRLDGTFEGPWTRTTGADGDLELAVRGSPLPRASGIQDSLFGAAGEQTEVKWDGDATHEDNALPIHSLYESGLSKPPGEAILLPASTEKGHLQILELSRWFAPRPDGSALKWWHSDSRVEPIVDGVPALKRLVTDLLACASEDCGAHFAGWAFKDFPLDSGRTDETGATIDTRITELTKRIIDNGGDVRFLVYKQINFKSLPDMDADAELAAIIALMALADALYIFSVMGAIGTDAVGFLVVFGGSVLGETLISKLFTPSRLIQEKYENSWEIFPHLNEIHKDIAIWSSYPARLIDNPVMIRPILIRLLDDYIDQVGSWHQKIQLIKRPADTGGNQYVAYIGGIDLNYDRLDTPGHHGKPYIHLTEGPSKVYPFHDVHARITGPVAADIFKTWDERYDLDRHLVASSLDPVFPPPAPDSLPLQPAKHITQVGRTYFKPKPVGGSAPFPFALEGEKITNDTLILAIKAAREYIYIEDQYFTPNDSQHPQGSADTYFDALLGAASTCKRLLILVPSETDQPFGDQRRRALFNRLKTVWGDRILIGTPMRRPILPNPGRLASEGRCILMRAITPLDDTVVIGPQVRVPKTVPFWLWIDGELMLSSGQPRPTPVDGTPSMEVDVLRGPEGTNPRWGATLRNHKKGAAVTLAQLKGIYVHAKIMMIDDIFVSIGSANMNRRGLLHDGEINIFTVPEQLKAASDNPACALRTALWAEHLGIAPSMGHALLSDPIAAFDLFLRSHYEGNRFMPFNALDLKSYLSVPTADGLIIQLLSASAIVYAATLIPTIWNDLSDPTSYNDPKPDRGP